MKIGKWMLAALLLLSISWVPMGAQDRNQRDNRNNQTFYRGVRNGGRGGQYYDPRYGNRQSAYQGNSQYSNPQYNNGYYANQGGIGPGKGALIGGAAGAALGAVFGKGLKSTIIGGAAGAGIGAAVGEVHKKQQQNQYYPQ